MWLRFAVFLLAAITGVSAADDSCEGRCDSFNHVGDTCKCDEHCLKYKNCCPDYEDVCPPPAPRGSIVTSKNNTTTPTPQLPARGGIRQKLNADKDSCEGRCENYDRSDTCKCDEHCLKYKNCCPDYEDVCPKPTPSGSIGTSENDDTTPALQLPANNPTSTGKFLLSCENRCDTCDRGMGCQCDEMCLKFNNCCPDYKDVCPQRDTCKNRCDTSDMHDKACQCDKKCLTFNNCCPDYHEVCPKPTEITISSFTTPAPDPDAEPCSGRPFDSFLQTKNGSIYAFRGLYFFELDQKAVLPGYPKLIQDVWGISGPIDAAFTRVNCQGKNYIFKGTKYWRFDNGVLEDDYPRDITVGFDKIPDHVDAAFALPASSQNGKERVYFFKGEQYYMYEFLHQPSHEECIKMSGSSQSSQFGRYTDIYYPNYEQFLPGLFSDLPQHHDNHHFINKDWKGLQAPMDAAMTGQIYVSSPGFPQQRIDSQSNQQLGRQQHQQNREMWGQRRSRSLFWRSTAEQGMRMGQRFAGRRMEMENKSGRYWNQGGQRDNQRQNNYDSRAESEIPIQSVYFFKGDQYYRADLKTKRVDPAMPPYPRSITKFWLGCSNSTGVERK